MYTRLLLPAAIVLLWTQIACGKAIEPRATPFASAEPTSAPTDTPNSFRVLNFFSYDQAVATLKHPAPKGTTQQDTFVQFIFDDNEIGPNGGCQFAWDPSSNEKPPVGKTVVCEFDADKTATLKSYKGPGDFVIDLVHKYKTDVETTRMASLNINATEPWWVCIDGSCHIHDTYSTVTIPYTESKAAPGAK